MKNKRAVIAGRNMWEMALVNNDGLRYWITTDTNEVREAIRVGNAYRRANGLLRHRIVLMEWRGTLDA